jgi:hypothetical protein
MKLKQIRLNDSVRLIQSCFDCPMKMALYAEESCRLTGNHIPAKDRMTIPEDCNLEDAGFTPLEIVDGNFCRNCEHATPTTMLYKCHEMDVDRYAEDRCICDARGKGFKRRTA